MAQFKGTIQGNRGQASRLGGKASGLSANVNGWHCGIHVDAQHNEKTGEDEFLVYKTGGSNGASPRQMLAKVTKD